ncbi:hypothetical protein [Cupriavidus sp. TMH.W2]|uniref:hypothetical protein n=1 Tax=Cupriavidus sp. TMH.W2 TaxID=3434465 RepID=UPI003D778813
MSISLMHYSEREQLHVLRKLSYIQGIQDRGITRGQLKLIAEAARMIAAELGDKNTPGESSISAWMKKYEESGSQPTSLVSGREGVRRSASVDASHEEIVDKVINDKYCNLRRPSVKTAYLSYIRSVRRENRQRAEHGVTECRVMSERTFLRRIKAKPAFEVYESRYGHQAALAKFKHVKSSSPARSILDFAEIDHTRLNLYVIDDRLLIPLGRPWITVIRDRFSGAVLGFFVTFCAPSLRSVFGALKHSILPHRDVRGFWPGIINEWTPWGLSAAYQVDRGAEFMSESFRIAIAELGARYVYSPARQPWTKGSIERFFGMMELTFLDDIPGKTFRSLLVRGEYDPKTTAVVRFSTLIYLLHKWVVDFVHISPNSRKHLSPIEIWNQHVDDIDRVGISHIDKLEAVLGHRRTAPLTRRGIAFESLQYASADTDALFRKHGPGLLVDYVVAPENLGFIHLLHPDLKKYACIPCTSLDYANGLSLFQHKLLKRYIKDYRRRHCVIDDLANAQGEIHDSLHKDINKLGHLGPRELTGLAALAQLDSAAIYRGEIRSVLDCTSVPIDISPKDREEISNQGIWPTADRQRPDNSDEQVPGWSMD